MANSSILVLLLIVCVGVGMVGMVGMVEAKQSTPTPTPTPTPTTTIPITVTYDGYRIVVAPSNFTSPETALKEMSFSIIGNLSYLPFIIGISIVMISQFGDFIVFLVKKWM